MGNPKRLFHKAGLALIAAVITVGNGYSAPTPSEKGWNDSLNGIRMAVSPTPAKKIAAKAVSPAPAAVAATPPKGRGMMMPTKAQAKPTPTAVPKAAATPAPAAEVNLDLGAAYNKHLKSSLAFKANGWNIYASAGLNPDNPDGDYLILRVEDKASIVFDIRAMITLTQQLRAFEVNKMPIVLVGDPVFKWGHPERDSTLSVALNVNPDADKRLKEPQIGDTPSYLLKPFTMLEFRKSLWNTGTAVPLPGEDIRFFYGDAVVKGEKRLMTGDKKGFAFFRRTGEDKFSHAVLISEDKLAIGSSLTISLADNLMIRLQRVDENTLKVTKENPGK